MATLKERTLNLWNTVRQSEAQQPTRISIPVSQTDKSLGEEFKRNQNYFQIRVNEMFLKYDRQWVSTYMPLVTFISEFTYNKEIEAVPFVVGPSMIEDSGIEVPDQGMIFSNTRVAGLHPYRGGRITMTTILYQTERNNYARSLLTVMESAVGILDMATSLGMYTKIAGVVMDGLEALFDIGKTKPIVGWRQEFDPDAGDELKPGYFALINEPESEIDQSKLWVRDDKLYYGDSLTSATPFRQAAYVLYSLAQTNARSDIEMLPFQSLWERVRQDAEQPSENHWKSAKANMMSLYQTLNASPDLTAVQAKALATQYLDEMKENHEFAISIQDMEAGSHRGGEPRDGAKGILFEDGAYDDHDEVVDESVSILDLD